MCGRFRCKEEIEALKKKYGAWEGDELKARYNIAPTQRAPIFMIAKDGAPTLKQCRWGLVPFWAKDTRISSQTFNARSETVATKPAFRNAYKTHRCLVISHGFYEWKKVTPKIRAPYLFTFPEERLMTFAGLWETWRENEAAGPIMSFTILTTIPNDSICWIHDRMAVIVTPEDWDAWLDPKNTEVLAKLQAKQHSAGHQLQYWPVTPKMNSPKFESEECVLPVLE